MWLYDSLSNRGLKLLLAVIHGKGEAYVYLKTEYWRGEDGFYVEGSTIYIDSIVNKLELQQARPVLSPGTRRNILSLEEGSVLLDAERASTYASCVMLALRVAKYRHEILYTVKGLARCLKEPTTEQWARLKWLGRFLAGHRRA